MAQRTCTKCNKIFRAYGRRKNTAKFCSMKCREKRETRACLHCKNEFVFRLVRLNETLTRGKFCSLVCKRQYYLIIKNCLTCGKDFKVFPHKIKEGKGFYCSKECMQISPIYLQKLPRAETHHAWKGGVTPERHRIRMSTSYKKWRTEVFKRDNYTCQICSQRGGQIQADHIKSFAIFPDLRLDLNNGRTLCKPCHRIVTNELMRSMTVSEWRKYI